MSASPPEQPIYHVRLRPLRGVDAIRAFRRLLKFALRTCGLKTITVEEEK